MWWTECRDVGVFVEHCPPIVLGLICPPALENAATRPLQRFVEIHNESQKNAGTSPGAQGLRTDSADWDRVIAWRQGCKKSRAVYLHLARGPEVFSHPIFEAVVRPARLSSDGNLKGWLQ